MKTCVRIAAAAALLAFAQGCSDDDKTPRTTCTPTVQTEPDPAGAEAFCDEILEVFCSRAFGDCPQLGADLPSDIDTLEDCLALTALSCASSNEWYDPGCGAVCIAFARGADCDVLLATEDVQACDAATGYFSVAPPPPPPPPPPELPPEPIATVTAGTYSDTISFADPSWHGGYARAYAIYFTMGQTVTIETLAPTSGTAIGDTVVHLLAPSGVQVGWDDDNGNALYSRLATTIGTTGYHRIVVRGYDTSYVGGYQLSVTIPVPPVAAASQ